MNELNPLYNAVAKFYHPSLFFPENPLFKIWLLLKLQGVLHSQKHGKSEAFLSQVFVKDIT